MAEMLRLMLEIGKRERRVVAGPTAELEALSRHDERTVL